MWLNQACGIPGMWALDLKLQFYKYYFKEVLSIVLFVNR
jgi:hypothetical protein